MNRKNIAPHKPKLESQEAEERLKLMERLNLATHSAQMGIWDWDIRKNELVWDDQMYRLYGLKPGDFGGVYEAWLNGLHPDDRTQSDDASQMAVRGQKEFDTEYRVVWPDGSIHWLKADGQVFRDERGNPLRMVGVNYDITARKQAEERLKESEEYLRLGYEAGDLGIWKNDLQTGAVVFDERARIHYGFDTIHTTLLDVTKRIHPDDLARVGSEIEAATSPDGSGKFATEYRVVHADGSVHWLAIRVEVLFEGEGAQRHSVVGYGTTQDITARKQAEKILQDERRNLDALIENTDGSIWSVDVQYQLIVGNARYHRDTSAALGRRLLEGESVLLPGFPQAALDEWRGYYDRALQGENFSVEVQTRFADPVRYVEYRFNPIRTSTGAVRGVTVFGRDITERKRAEEALRLSKLDLQAAQSVARVGSWKWDIKSQEVIWSDEMYRIFGIAKNSYTGRLGEVVAKVIHPDDLHIVLPSNAATLANEPVEYRIILSDGSIRQIWAKSGESILDSEGKPTFLTGIAQDITERKQAEQRLRTQYEIARILSESATLAEATPKILQTVCEQLGWNWGELWSVDHSSAVLRCVEIWHVPSDQYLEFEADTRTRTFQAGEGLPGKVWVSHAPLWIVDVRKDPTFSRAAFAKKGRLQSGFAFPLQLGNVVHGVAAFLNHEMREPDKNLLEMFTATGMQIGQFIERKQAEAEIRQLNIDLEQRVKARTIELLHANTELERANRTKDEFLANMSHELRTPLTGILGLSESMQLSTYGEPNEKQVKALQSIEASGHHLLDLINDILDLSKIEAGKFNIYPEMISLEDTCRASLMFVKEQAMKKSVTVEYQQDPSVRSVFADPRRLKQILVNLLSNAVKFTPEKGNVTLAVHADPENGLIHFMVTDTGIGITPEDTERLFTPFTQVDSRLNRQYEGTGLGLALVLRLAEMHGGNIQVESEPGKGSSFTVSIPLQPQVIPQTEVSVELTHQQTPEPIVPNSRGVLLLAEDNNANIETIGDYLEFKGYTIIIASNGMEALIKAEETTPQLILMDIQMPDMDGLEATRRLRSDPRFASTPIIALTALAMTGDRERCIEAGANDFMSKPVRLKELLQKIEKLLSR